MPNTRFSALNRELHLAHARSQAADLLVVGGGITGAGIARDAAMRGMKVVLVDKNDLASGTSSQSSKLIHGGLRYLAQMEFGLVFEAVRERTRLRELAPHLCVPTPFLLPVFRGDRRGLHTIGAGLAAYDALSLFRVYRRHKTYGADSALELEPSLNPERLLGCAVYYDSRTDDARLTLETALDAHRHGAAILTHTKVERFEANAAGQLKGAMVVDQLSGQQFALEARLVVLAAGPWGDSLRGAQRPPMLRPTKGVHLVVERSRLPVRHAVVLNHPDGRIIFTIPWNLHTVIGTTDTDWSGNPDLVAANKEDVDYLLEITNGFFPDAGLGYPDVVSTWAGLRPLVAEEGAKHASDVSREHVIHQEEDGMLVIAGGKLTTFRSMAEELVDKAARILQRADHTAHFGPCSTASVPLPGALEEAEPPLLGLDPGTVEHLKRRYGTCWARVLRFAEGEPALTRAIVPGLPDIWAELPHAVLAELCCTATDFLRRRTQITLRTKDQGESVLEETLSRMASLLDWSEEDTQRNRAQYQTEIVRARCWQTEDVGH